MTARIILGMAGLMSIAMPAAFAFAETDDVARGQRLAERLCASCHMNPGQGEKSGPAGIPGFQAVADRPGQSMASIVTWLKSAPKMMPNHRLTQDEIYQLAQFIVALKAGD
jgi:mono/diheme cytochrome c family protein